MCDYSYMIVVAYGRLSWLSPLLSSWVDGSCFTVDDTYNNVNYDLLVEDEYSSYKSEEDY